MLILYNIIQLTFIILFFPVLLIYTAMKPKYRDRIPRKLGKRLRKQISPLSQHKKTIWIHALSVGEVTSALPLVARVRQDFKDTNIVFSASTKSGSKLAEELITQHCDQIIVFPLDIFYVVKFFLDQIKPNLFILVETDFWPNFLHQLKHRDIPAILVNGRISKKSIAYYRKFRFFFNPMFRAFSILCVQTETDRSRLIDLGLIEEKVRKLGNLKYEPVEIKNKSSFSTIIQGGKGLLIVAGSTHPGEEELLLQSFLTLKPKHNIRMIIAPRQIERGRELVKCAQNVGLEVSLRSSYENFHDDIFILDTIGELMTFYSFADISFVGGSLVNEGGHNPIEPASYSKPVLFGPHMEDFEEISKDLLQSGGAFSIKDQNNLTETLDRLLEDEQFRLGSGKAAFNCISEKQGVLDKHMKIIREYM